METTLQNVQSNRHEISLQFRNKWLLAPRKLYVLYCHSYSAKTPKSTLYGQFSAKHYINRRITAMEIWLILYNWELFHQSNTTGNIMSRWPQYIWPCNEIIRHVLFVTRYIEYFNFCAILWLGICYYHGLIKPAFDMRAWISIHILTKGWDVITTHTRTMDLIPSSCPSLS